MNSNAELLASLNESELDRFLDQISDQDATDWLYSWDFWARDNQVPPDTPWRCWLILAGRGFGKTRTGAEWVLARQRSGYNRIGLVGETAADVRDVMIEGESGILACAPPDNRPLYEPSKRRITWSNGAIATAYSGDDPDQLRGPAHDSVWADEPAKWRYADETWSNLELGLRSGDNPQVVATTTPRPIKLIRQLVADPKTHVTAGSTYDNIANLSPAFIERVVQQYEGTRLGQQELYARILDDVPGALWTRDILERNRIKKAPDLSRIVVAIDPAMTSGEEADMTGLVVAARGSDKQGYVLEDATMRGTPDQWARKAIELYEKWSADRIVAETNNGGEMVEYTLRTLSRNVSYKSVHATRGKRLRAEPIAALYEQGKVHHVGLFEDLEDQQCTFVPDQTDESPDRVDALVWALTDLMVTARQPSASRQLAGF